MRKRQAAAWERNRPTVRRPILRRTGLAAVALLGLVLTASAHTTRLVPLVKFQCRPGGQIAVSGYVPSYEDKLAVSLALRQVSGCTSVVNILHVVSGDQTKAPTSDPEPLVTAPLATSPATADPSSLSS